MCRVGACPAQAQMRGSGVYVVQALRLFRVPGCGRVLRPWFFLGNGLFSCFLFFSERFSLYLGCFRSVLYGRQGFSGRFFSRFLFVLGCCSGVNVFRLLGLSWELACGVTCRRPLLFWLCSKALTVSLDCRFLSDRWFLLGTVFFFFGISRWNAGIDVVNPFSPSCLFCWVKVIDLSSASGSAQVNDIWDNYANELGAVRLVVHERVLVHQKKWSTCAWEAVSRVGLETYHRDGRPFQECWEVLKQR